MNRSPSPFGPAMASGIRDEYQLLLCSHGFKHFWGALKWLCDFPWLSIPLILFKQEEFTHRGGRRY